MEKPVEKSADELQAINLPLKESLVKVEKIKLNTHFFYLLFFISFFVIFMYVSQIYMENYNQIQTKKIDILNLKQKVEDLSLENERLENIIVELKTPEGLEKLARKKLNLIRSGEKLIRWKIK